MNTNAELLSYVVLNEFLIAHVSPSSKLSYSPTKRVCAPFSFSRSLDLTGPLLLGGVPNLPEDFPVRHREFVGCMRNLTIDNKQLDMASFIANNGTLAGKS